MALATLHMAAIPVLAGLLAGTGAVATFVSGGGEPVKTAALATASPETGRSCETQAWPYIERKCLAAGTSADNRPVRFVAAPASMAPAETTPAPAPSAAPSGDLVSRDTVLRAPHYTNTIAAVPDTVVPEQRATRKQMRREARKQSAERRFAAQSYQVPGEFDRRSVRPVIVVRPLRLDAFR